jgi:14-3-3 protein epsilon
MADQGADDVPVKDHEVYYAMLAEQAERYDEMAAHMRTAALIEDELTEKERTLLAVAYKQAAGMRRAAWRVVCNREKHELGRGNDDTAACAKNLRKQIEAELTDLSDSILQLLTDHLIPKASSTEAKVQYYKAQGDYFRYKAEISDDVYRTRATNSAKQAYEDGTRIAEMALPVTDHYRLGLALNHAVFQFECMKSPNEACRIARKAFEDAVREIDSLGDSESKHS